MIRAVEPGAPEPVQVNSRGIFHSPEKIGRGRPLELPAIGILTEGKIKQLPPHDRLPQYRERRSGLDVGIGTKLQDGVRLGHHRHLVLGRHVTRYVIENVGVIPERRVILLPLELRHILEERIEAFIHPGPLPLIGIDDHRKVNVPYLVDDHPDQPIFDTPRIGPLRVGPAFG